MDSLDSLQCQVSVWVETNFPNHPPHHPLLGIVEEVGELAHAMLKREQDIRLDEDHQAQIKDAVGDIVIYLLDFCDSQHISLAECVHQAWSEVRKRDWVKHRSEHEHGQV